jgi:hypothetical protein
MIMSVTDDQVEALRALLVDDMDRYRLLFSKLDRDEARTGYPALVTAAFGEAVERRFGGSHEAREIVQFVADVRARSDRLASELDPDVAECAILAVLGKGSTRNLSRHAVSRAKLVLLAALVSDEQLGGEKLDAFLASARRLANQLIG